MSATLPLALALEPMGDPARAASLSRELALPLIDDPHQAELLLVLGPQGLALRRPNDPALTGELRVDFDRPAARRRQQSPHRELVVQAARLRRAGESPLVVDATAGLGRDGFLLAAGPRKVVVKRPLKGPALAGPAPSHVLRGKAVRFDVYTGVGVATEAK